MTTIRFESGPPGPFASSVRKFVGDLYGRILGDADVTSRLALTAHEFVENLSKYSSPGETSISIGFSERESGLCLRVLSRNRTTRERLSVLCAVLDRIGAAENPKTMYNEFMEETLDRDGVSGLGLARIRVEGEMDLHYQIDGDTVTIIAETPMPPASEEDS